MSRIARALGAGLALITVMAGVPWLLVSLAAWPLPTTPPDWSNVARMIEQGDIAGTSIVKGLACVVWVAWAVVAWAVVWEAVVNVPRMLKGRLHRPNPLAPAALSKGVGWLFAFLIVTTSTSQTAHATTSLGSLHGLDVDDAASTSLVVDADATASESVEADAFDDFTGVERTEVWVVADDDSLWSISQHTGVSIDEILAINDRLTPTTMLTAGMRIQLPAGADIPEQSRGHDAPVGYAGDSHDDFEPQADHYVVQVNDGMWNVAEALLGDGSRHVEMARLAIGQQVAPGVVFTDDTHVIHPGWVFTLDTATPPTSHTYTVRSGDSLSSIAGDHLGDADRWLELWDLNRDRMMIDGRTFDDPDLIHPGWQLHLVDLDSSDGVEADPDDGATVEHEAESVPTGDAGDDMGGPIAAPAPSDDAIEEPSSPPQTEPPPSSAAPSVSTEPDRQSDAALPPPGPEARPERVPSTTTTSSSDIESSGGGESDTTEGVEESAWERTVWVGVAAGTLLLAGLGVMTHRLRNRRLGRLEPGRRLVGPPAVAAGTELAVTRSSERLTELTTLRGLLQSVTPYAAEQSDPPGVRAVQIGDERVEILFASPAPLPPKGWTTVDGGQSWTHRFDDEPITSRQLLTPALVTIGIRDGDHGDEVLLDLETAASVAVRGDADAAVGLARSMALELATYPLGVPVEVGTIGMHVDGTETCDRVWLDTTLQRALRVTRQRLEHVGLHGATSMLAARARLDEDDGTHDPMVFFVHASAIPDSDRPLLDELVDICQPSTGVAVVVIGDHSGAKEQITVDADGRLKWSDVELLAPNVTRRAAAEASVLLDHAANADDEPLEPVGKMSELLDVTAPTASADEPEEGPAPTPHDETADDAVPDYEYEPPPHDVLLRLMGNVAVEGCDLTYDDVELLGVMTCLRGRTEIHIDLIQNLIAPDSVRKTVENRIGRLRKKLGVGSDDFDLLPAASSTGRGLNAIYDVSPLVLTDVDLLEHRLHTAHGLGSTDALRVLADGLDFMAGPLFRARKGFDGWPHTEGVVQAMTAVVSNYARDLIELAAEVDDIALVVRTSACAGHVLDNPAVEAPFRQVEAEYAEACGDEQLIASVECARKRLLDHLRHEDSLASS